MQQKHPYLTITKNNSKQAGDNRPDLRGFITIHEALPAGQYEIGLYSGVTKHGSQKYSGPIRPKQEEKKAEAHWQEMNSEEIPF